MSVGYARTERGELSRPSYENDHLYATIGYVSRIWVDQEDTRDAVWFTLQVQRDDDSAVEDHVFRIGLHTNTPVALAQFQLLRDALRSRWSVPEETTYPLAVLIHFNYDEEYTWVYLVKLIYWRGEEYTVVDYFGEDSVGAEDWWIKG